MILRYGYGRRDGTGHKAAMNQGQMQVCRAFKGLPGHKHYNRRGKFHYLLSY